MVSLTATTPRTKDTTQSLAGTGGHATGDQDVQIKIWKGTVTTGAPDREFTASVNSSANWTLFPYTTLFRSSTLTTKDDALSGDDTYSIKVSQDDDLSN